MPRHGSQHFPFLTSDLNPGKKTDAVACSLKILWVVSNLPANSATNTLKIHQNWAQLAELFSKHDFECFDFSELEYFIKSGTRCDPCIYLFFLLIFLNTAGVSKQHQKNSSKPTFTKWLAEELYSWYCTHLASHWVIMVIISNYGLISKKCCSLKYFERLVFFANRGR